jgi:hypothetical protein
LGGGFASEATAFEEHVDSRIRENRYNNCYWNQRQENHSYYPHYGSPQYYIVVERGNCRESRGRNNACAAHGEPGERHDHTLSVG